jgi:hypothetical protein
MWPDLKLPSKATVSTYKVRLAEDIRDRRAELADTELPVLDPAWRYLRLQEIIEESVAGIEKKGMRGETYLQKDYKSAISALAEVNKMTGFTGKNREEDDKDSKRLMKQILEELRADLLKAGNKPEEVDEIIRAKEAEFISDLAM